MKQKTITLYEYSELSPEAKKRAHEKWNANSFDDYELTVHLNNLAGELLEKNGIKPEEKTYAKLYYSLGHNQGDGLVFAGVFDWGKYRIYIKQSGHYNHSHSKTVEMQEADNLGFHIENEKDENAFEAIYQSICKELERAGYEYIDDMQSEAYFIEACNANEYTFREDGTMEN